MKRQTLNINFYCRETKANRMGLAPIEISIIINGERSFITLQRKATPLEFKQAMANKKQSDIKDYCDTVRRRLDEIIDELMAAKIELTAATLKEYFSKGGVHTIYSLNDMINEYLSIQNSRVGNDIIEETYTRYVEARDKFYSVMNLTGDEPATSIGHREVLQFQAALLKEYKTDTAAHYLTRVKSFFNYGFKAGKLPSFAFNSITIHKERNKKIIYLTDIEISLIRSKKFSSERLYNVSRLFLFQCYTGLSYADMALLEPEDYKENNKGQIYITKNRKKTGVEFTTVLLKDAIDIAAEYDYKLPLLSNQKYNAYLKEIQDVCGIKKNLTTHIARHTFACYLLNNLKQENAIEIVAKVMGHSDTKVTRKYYAALFENTVFDSLSLLNDGSPVMKRKTFTNLEAFDPKDEDFKNEELDMDTRIASYKRWNNRIAEILPGIRAKGGLKKIDKAN